MPFRSFTVYHGVASSRPQLSVRPQVVGQGREAVVRDRHAEGRQDLVRVRPLDERPPRVLWGLHLLGAHHDIRSCISSRL